MEVLVRTPTGVVIHINATGSSKIEDVKILINGVDNSYSLDDFNLSSSGQIMEDSKTLADYNVRQETVIQMVR